MKRLVIIFFQFSVLCRGQLNIDFEQGGTAGWIQDRPLSWDTSSFEVLSGRFSLRHIYDNPDPGNDRISIRVDSLYLESGNTEWQFKIRHGYNPSAANNWVVFLISSADATEMHPGGNTSGYAVGVNYDGSDDLLKLWRIDKGEEYPIITTGLNWQEGIGTKAAGIKIIRSAEGVWEIFVDRQGTFDHFIVEGNGTDNEIMDMQHFGIYYQYSSRQDQKLWIDDIMINGGFEQDSIPPGIHDFFDYIPKKHDVIINEIMADPSPSVGLPEYEYIELMNRSDYPVDMNGWTMECGKTIKTFTDILFPPGEFLLLVHKDAEEIFMKYGNCVPLFTSRTSLQNTGELIKLLDGNRNLISWLNYSDEWYTHDYYSSGGWSLERKDPDRFCGGIENWSVSKDTTGGTPGRVNSVYGMNPDTVRPRVMAVEIPEDTRLEVYFSEPMDSIPQLEPGNFHVDPDIGHPAVIILRGPDYQAVSLELESGMEPGKIYHLSFSDELRDCAGNRLDIPEPVKIGKPEFPTEGDILISEIMFDPLPGKVEFLELYNKSDKVINLGSLLISRRDETSGEISSLIPVYNGNRLFFPGDFLLLTSDIQKLISGYPRIEGIQIEVPGMPVFENDEGDVVILDLWMNIIDEFKYHHQMHFSLLSVTDGVSLERISYEMPAGDPGNWHSAAESEGFSTPGYSNSQSVTNINLYTDIKIEPEIFTPDNDGNDDFTNIWYSFDHPGCVTSIWIFDPAGRIIRKLTDNQLVGLSGFIAWDGIDDHGQRAGMGIYLVFIRIFDLEGRVREVKKTCVLSLGGKE